MFEMGLRRGLRERTCIGPSPLRKAKIALPLRFAAPLTDNPARWVSPAGHTQVSSAVRHGLIEENGSAARSVG